MAAGVVDQRRQRAAQDVLARPRPRGGRPARGPRRPRARGPARRGRPRPPAAPSSRRATASSVSTVSVSVADCSTTVLQRRRALGVGVRAGRGQPELGAAADPRDRRAQLVGDLAREALLVAARGGDAGQQPVEGRGQAGQLVARRPEVEAAVEVVGAPVLGAGGHVLRRAAARRRSPPQRDAAGEHDQRGDDQRPDEDLLLQVLQRRGRERDDDRATRRVAPGAVIGATRTRMSSGPVVVADRRGRGRGRSPPREPRRHVGGPLEDLVAVEDPRLAVERSRRWAPRGSRCPGT